MLQVIDRLGQCYPPACYSLLQMAQVVKYTEKPFRGVYVTSFDTHPPDWDILNGHLRYLAYTQETYGTSNLLQWQIFAYAFKSQRFSAFKKMFPKNHIEKMQGKFRDNECYCSKEGKLIGFGVKPNEDGIKTTVLNTTEAVAKRQKHNECTNKTSIECRANDPIFREKLRVEAQTRRLAVKVGGMNGASAPMPVVDEAPAPLTIADTAPAPLTVKDTPAPVIAQPPASAAIAAEPSPPVTVVSVKDTPAPVIAQPPASATIAAKPSPSVAEVPVKNVKRPRKTPAPAAVAGGSGDGGGAAEAPTREKKPRKTPKTKGGPVKMGQFKPEDKIAFFKGHTGARRSKEERAANPRPSVV